MLKEIFKKKDNQFMLILIVVAFFFLFVGFYLLKDKNLDNPNKIPNSIEEVVWNKFESKKYNFNLNYPEHFELYEGNLNGDPAFNIYFRIYDKELPLSYTSNQSQFSIYPLGLAFGGANLTYIESEFKNENNLEFKTKEFKTLQGETWGVMYVPKDTPKGWNETGFIWISSRIKKMEFECLSNGVKKDSALCNIYEGDQAFKKGEIDKDFLSIGEEILNKINFN
jgi:hypothetical protein